MKATNLNIKLHPHNRRTVRLREYDYSWPGWYYVTFCTHDRECWFGQIIGNGFCLTSLGELAGRYWREIPSHHPTTEMDTFVVMPNHLHGIIILTDTEPPNRRDVQLNVPTANINYSKISPQQRSLAVIVRTYKAAVTTWGRAHGYAKFRWQQRFYDHVIRTEQDLHRLRHYIANNPMRWALDEENPAIIKDY